MIVTVYTRPGCHLCEKAISAMAGTGVPFEEVDISRDPFLEREFGIFVPVVQVDGKTIYEAGMDAGALPGLLEEQLHRP